MAQIGVKIDGRSFGVKLVSKYADLAGFSG